ncbi:hypothetical protein ACFY8O_34275 [Streptomyces argenteolus]|uniref:Uncharacterized protein n=1 Tax=Streptomyces argenteolus TaxID=67274 RepID=A0ABW6XGR6_9ACTN
MDWIVPLLTEWTAEVRTGFGVGGHPALWVTERCGRISLRRHAEPRVRRNMANDTFQDLQDRRLTADGWKRRRRASECAPGVMASRLTHIW